MWCAGARVVRWRDGEGWCGGRLVARGAALSRQRGASLIRAGVAIQGAARRDSHCGLMPGQAGAPRWGYHIAMGCHSMSAQPRAARSATYAGVDSSSSKAGTGWSRRVGSHCPVQGAWASRQDVDPHHTDLRLWPSLGFQLEASLAIRVVRAGVS